MLDNRIRPEDVRVTLIPIDSIQQHPENNNVGDDGAIGESIDELGFFDPITVQKSSGNIITGNHSWLAYRQRGATEVPAIVYDVDDLMAKRMLVAHNKTNRRGHDDGASTLALLESIIEGAGTEYALVGTGYHLDDYRELLETYGQLPVLPCVPDQAPDITTGHQAPDAAPPARTAGDTPALFDPKPDLREMVLMMRPDEHADIVATVADLRKRHMPGGYSTGQLIHAAVAAMASAVRAEHAHPDLCPCSNCETPDAHPDACVCKWCAAGRPDDEPADPAAIDLRDGAGLLVLTTAP